MLRGVIPIFTLANLINRSSPFHNTTYDGMDWHKLLRKHAIPSGLYMTTLEIECFETRLTCWGAQTWIMNLWMSLRATTGNGWPLERDSRVWSETNEPPRRLNVYKQLIKNGSMYLPKKPVRYKIHSLFPNCLLSQFFQSGRHCKADIKDAFAWYQPGRISRFSVPELSWTPF